MIDAVDLTKKFGDKVAVDHLSFSVMPGMVTGFLGPNGAGKSTTMRLILGLDHPTSGSARVNGRAYTRFRAPMTRVGSLLEAKSVHPGRTARNHLRALAVTHGIPAWRVDEVIELAGLSTVAKKRAGEFSLGMSQRLGLAAALLGDPQTLILDEPVNGLDPEGVAWVRGLVKHLAAQERTVFISSHLMSEMALTADRVVIIGRGRLIADEVMSDLISRASGVVTQVRSPQRGEIAQVAQASGHKVADAGDGLLSITGWSAERLGREAAARGWVLYELRPVHRSLEEGYLELTTTSVEFHASIESELDEAVPHVGFWSGAVPPEDVVADTVIRDDQAPAGVFGTAAPDSAMWAPVVPAPLTPVPVAAVSPPVPSSLGVPRTAVPPVPIMSGAEPPALPSTRSIAAAPYAVPQPRPVTMPPPVPPAPVIPAVPVYPGVPDAGVAAPVPATNQPAPGGPAFAPGDLDATEPRPRRAWVED